MITKLCALLLFFVFFLLIRWIFAHTYPENVDRFIAVSTPHPNLMWANLNGKCHINDSWLKLVQVPYLPEKLMAQNDAAFLEKAMPHIRKDNKYIRNGHVNGDDRPYITDKWEAYKYVYSQHSDWTGPLNYYRNFPFYRIKAGEMIRCPCLIVTGMTDGEKFNSTTHSQCQLFISKLFSNFAGNEDTLCRLDAIVKSTEYCDNYLVKIIENAGHWPHQEMANEFNRVVLKFLVGRFRLKLK